MPKNVPQNSSLKRNLILIWLIRKLKILAKFFYQKLPVSICFFPTASYQTLTKLVSNYPLHKFDLHPFFSDGIFYIQIKQYFFHYFHTTPLIFLCALKFEEKRKQCSFSVHEKSKYLRLYIVVTGNTNLAPFATCSLHNSKKALHLEKCNYVTVFVCFSSVVAFVCSFVMTRSCFRSALLGEKLFLKYVMKKSI